MIIENPRETASFIELGYNDDTGYFINFLDRAKRKCLHLTMGSGVCAAMFMLTNDITHFDYHSTLFNDSDATGQFIKDAHSVGYPV